MNKMMTFLSLVYVLWSVKPCSPFLNTLLEKFCYSKTTRRYRATTVMARIPLMIFLFAICMFLRALSFPPRYILSAWPNENSLANMAHS